MSAHPSVSVLLTTYNRERYVAEAIESVLAQTFEDFELIVSDDGLQHYRLARWKTGTHDINYRRFFAIDSLVGLRVERPEVFHAAHAVLADRELTLGCAFDVPGSPAVGGKAGSLTIGSDPAAAASCDVLIDFTRPEGTLANLKYARAMVIGDGADHGRAGRARPGLGAAPGWASWGAASGADVAARRRGRWGRCACGVIAVCGCADGDRCGL